MSTVAAGEAGPRGSWAWSPWMLGVGGLVSGAALGGLGLRPVLLAGGLVAVVAALVGGGARRSLALAAVVGLVVGGARVAIDEAGLVPLASGEVHATVVLADDPRPVPSGVRAEARWGGHRVDLRARGGAGGTLRSRVAGEAVAITGRMRDTPLGPWQASRHVVGVVDVASAEPAGAGGGSARAVNSLRDLLARGLDGLPPADRSLALGLTIGDDRDLTATREADLRAAGLGHLTAVSGQNVAVVLALLSPLVARSGVVVRLVVGLAALLVVVGMTRAEPSVMRAAGVGGVVLAGAAVGRPTQGLRALAAAVGAMVLVDPFLVRRLGFQLSVAASAGILAGAPGLARWLEARRVPTPLATAMAVSGSAQVAVAPVLAAMGDPVPLVALPANVAAGPGAALATTWGLAAGLPAGLAARAGLEGLATALHAPTFVGQRWVAAVGEVAARGPRAWAGWPTIALLVAAGLWWCAPRLGGLRLGALRLGGPRGGARRSTAVTWVLVVAAAGSASVPPTSLATGTHTVAPGAEVIVGATGEVVVVDGRSDPTRVVESLRRSGRDRPSAVVQRTSGSRSEATVAVLVHRHPPVAVVRAPGGGELPGPIRLGDRTVVLRPDGDRWQVAVEPIHPGDGHARDPPVAG